MDTATMWALGLLSGASGGGFLLLLGLVNKVSRSIDMDMKVISERVNHTPTFQYLHENYMSKETLVVYFKSIDDKLTLIQKFIEDYRDRREK